MIAYKLAMQEINNNNKKIQFPIKNSETKIIKYPLHNILNNSKITSYPKNNFSLSLNKPPNLEYIKKADISNHVNEMNDLYSLNIKLKYDHKPNDYYQYNMGNKNMSDFRLDAYQNELNVKSDISIAREENETDKSINELKDDESDFQTNLNIILQEYKNKQVDFNTRKIKPIVEELDTETDIINDKLEILTKDNNKKPIIYKPFTRPILTKDDEISEIVTQIFNDNLILKEEMKNIEEIKLKLNESQKNDLENFIDKLAYTNTNIKKINKENLEKHLIKFFKNTNNYIYQHFGVELNLPEPPPKEKRMKKTTPKETTFEDAVNNIVEILDNLNYQLSVTGINKIDDKQRILLNEKLSIAKISKLPTNYKNIGIIIKNIYEKIDEKREYKNNNKKILLK